LYRLVVIEQYRNLEAKVGDGERRRVP